VFWNGNYPFLIAKKVFRRTHGVAHYLFVKSAETNPAVLKYLQLTNLFITCHVSVHRSHRYCQSTTLNFCSHATLTIPQLALPRQQAGPLL